MESIVWDGRRGGGKACLVAMVTAYLDESLDGQQQRVFLLAGYVGYAEHWEILWDKWNKVLADVRVPEFHAVDCEHGRNHFDGMSQQRRQGIHRRFVELMADERSGLIGHVQGIMLDAYNEIRPQLKALRRVPPGDSINGSLDDPYYFGFQAVVEAIARSSAASVLPTSEKVDFVFDTSALSGKIPRLFQSIADDGSLGAWTTRLGSVQFRSRVGTPPLQAADLWAYEAYRYAMPYFAGQTPVPRWQYSELAKGVDWKKAGYFNESALRECFNIPRQPYAACSPSGE